MPLNDPFPQPPPPPGGGCPNGFTGTPPNCIAAKPNLPEPPDYTQLPGNEPAPIPFPGGGNNPQGGGGQPGERDANDLPCGPNQCKDVVTGQCRSFNPRREKVNMTDQWERDTGGGRGYCRQLDPGRQGGGGGGPFGGGGGGGGPQGGGGPFAPDPPPGMPSDEFAKLLESMLTDNLNAPSRYSDQAMQALYGQTASQAAGAIERGERGVRADAARSGMSRAGVTGNALREVRSGAESQRGASNVGIMQAKINADHEDKMAALDRSQQYLDTLRDNEYRYALMGEQRKQFDANLTLAYANLAQQKELLIMQLAQQMNMLNMQLQSDWDMLRARAGLDFLG